MNGGRIPIALFSLALSVAAQDEWQGISDAAKKAAPLEKIRLLQSIVSAEPVVSGTERAEILGRHRFELGEAAEAALESRKTGKLTEGSADYYARVAVASYGQAIVLGFDTGDALCRQVAVSSENSGNWSEVEAPLFGAITQVSALAWRRQIAGLLTGGADCKKPPAAGAIPQEGVRTLFGALLLTYSAIPVSIRNFYCEEWPTLADIGVKHVELAGAIHALDAGYDFGTCENERRSAFGGAFETRSASRLQRFVDDRETVASILERIGDELVQMPGEKAPGTGSWTDSELAALRRYWAAWTIDSENTGAALKTADLLAAHANEITDAKPKQLVSATQDSLLHTYAFPSGLRRTGRWIARLAHRDVDRTFDQYTFQDLRNLIDVYAVLQRANSGIHTPARLKKEYEDLRSAQPKLQLPRVLDGSKVLHGFLAGDELAPCKDALPGKVQMVRGELHSFWPPALNVSAAAVSSKHDEFGMRFRRRFVAGQYLSVRDYRTGCALQCPQCGAGEDWLYIPVRPRKPSWSPVYDGGPVRLYIDLRNSLLSGAHPSHRNFGGRVTAGISLHIWRPGLLQPQRSAEDRYPAPGTKHEGMVTMLQLYAAVDTDAMYSTVHRQTDSSAGVTLIQAERSRTLEAGIYAPLFHSRLVRRWQFWRLGIFNSEERPNAVFVAPLVKGGVDLVDMACCDRPLAGRESRFWAVGGRMGLLRFVPGEHNVSSSLLSFLDVTVGRWERFATFSSTAPARAEVSATTALPWRLRLLTAGLSANVGRGGSELRVQLGFRLDIGWALSKLARYRQL